MLEREYSFAINCIIIVLLILPAHFFNVTSYSSSSVPLSCTRFITFYRTQITQLLQKQLSRVLKIQRLYRAHVVRSKLIPQLVQQVRKVGYVGCVEWGI